MSRLTGKDPDTANINEQGVNSSGQALTFSVGITEFEDASKSAKAFNWSSGIIDIDAGDTVLLVKNTSSEPLKIESVTIWNGSIASEYRVHLPTTEVETPTGTAVVGTNLKVGDSAAADAIAKSDETTNTEGSVVFTPMMGVDSNLTINTVGLHLSQNKSVAINVIEDTSESGVSIRGHY